MKPTNDITVLFADSGLFLNLARTLSRSVKRLLYWSPECRPFPSLRQAVIGDGFDNIERVGEFWSQIQEIDLFVFPDVQLPDLQIYLEQQEYPVWGARKAMNLELKREYFLRMLDEVGLSVPDYRVCVGLRELAEDLKDKEDQFIKVSRFRGDLETHHWRNWTQDRGWLDKLAVQLGPLSDHMRFVVCPKIESDLEIGGDGFNIDGAWPKLFLNGIEGKDKSYLSAVTRTDDMPEQVREVMAAFGPYLWNNRYRQFWSSELRIAGHESFYIDATMRGGMPSNGSQQMLWQNLPEIMWAGAQGELVEPEPTARFSIETMITAKRESETWETVAIDKELEGHAQFYNCAFVDGAYVFPQSEYDCGDLGWLVATGDTVRETLDKQKELADLLPDGLSADVEALADVINSIDEGRKDGVTFAGQQQLPDKSEVL